MKPCISGWVSSLLCVSKGAKWCFTEKSCALRTALAEQGGGSGGGMLLTYRVQVWEEDDAWRVWLNRAVCNCKYGFCSKKNNLIHSEFLYMSPWAIHVTGRIPIEKQSGGNVLGFGVFFFAVVAKKWHYPQIIPGWFTFSLIRPLKSLTLSQWSWFYSCLPSPPALRTPALDNFVSLGEKAAAGRAALQGCCRAVQGTGSH